MFQIKKLILLILISLSLSCDYAQNSAKTDLIQISGNITGFTPENNKVYFVNTYYWEKFLDSADVKNGAFLLQVPKAKYPESFLAAISYKVNNRIKKFKFINHVLTTKDQGYLLESFLLDTPTITIKGNFNAPDHLTIAVGNETQALFRTQMMEFGYLHPNPVTRTSQLNEYISIIEQYPNSQYLLSEIFANKAVLKQNELIALLKRFHSNALQSTTGKKLQMYVTQKSDQPFIKNMTLVNEKGIPVNMIDSNAKMNIIIVWASWCAPCRKEIPDLKKIYTQYNEKGVRLVSVSIDDNINKWQEALLTEKMQWAQLYVSENNLQQFKQDLEVGAIPYVLFLDNSRKLISNSIGMSQKPYDDYKQIIDNYLKQNEKMR